MKFIADENFPLDSVRALRLQGYDVVAVAEEMPGASDEEVLQRAATEARIVLTFDRDFGYLVFRLGMPAPLGAVLFRDGPARPAEPADLLLRIISRGEIVLSNKFTVVERDRVRQRPLP